ncbi:MAG: CDP-diacylglycerol--serine O-phosphatidyltransferase [Beggiatoa sp. IS2]|nr:MAG: CDP-diacylglycerol--serine O-phosphatidyltransferase [Beggiatoa sp. IS2]
MTAESETEFPEKPKQRKGIYLLPNLFTTAALFSGFYSIVAAINGRFEAAAVAIFVAMVLDGVDGRVARLTNTQSAFGMEYDSLADLISFGLAPALLMYKWSLASLGKVGWLAAFIYTVFAALRLARFNTQIDKVDKQHFQGLPSPAAAAFVAGFVWVSHDYGFAGISLAFPALIVTLIAAVLMVSNIRYRSFKSLDLKVPVPFVSVLAVAILFVLVSIDPPQILFLGFFIYAFSGPGFTLIQLRKRRLARLKEG